MELSDFKLPIHIFLDTNVYISNKFNYENKVFKTLEKLINEEKVQLLINDIVENEVISNIKIVADEVGLNYKNAYKKLKKDVPSIEKNCKVFEEVQILEPTKFIADSLIKEFEDFLDKYSFEKVDLEIDADLLISDYFNSKYPFGSGKKKNEFPDAITIQSLRKYCDFTENKMIVISSDKDFINSFSGSDNILIYEGFRDFFTSFNEYYNEEIYKFASSYNFRLDQISFIKRKLEDYLYNNAHENFPSEWEDPEIDVKMLGQITEITIDEIYEDIVEFTIDIPIEFRVDYSEFNPDKSFYDKEDDEYLIYEYDFYRDEYATVMQIQLITSVNIKEKELEIDELEVINDSFDSDLFTLVSRLVKEEDGYHQVNMYKTMIEF